MHNEHKVTAILLALMVWPVA